MSVTPPADLLESSSDLQVPARSWVSRAPWALVLFGIVSVQIGAAFAKQLFDVSGTAGVVFIRTFIGAIVFTLIWRPKWRGYTREVYVYMTLYGAVIAANMLLFYAAISRIPLGVAVAIAFCGPLLVAVLGSRKLMDFVWVALAAVGILLLSPFANVTLDGTGVLLAFLCAGAWALYILFTKRVSGLIEGHASLAISMCIAAVVALPFGGAGAVKILGDGGLIVTALVVALLSSIIPFAADFTAIKYLTPRVFGLLASLEPVVAAIIGFVVLQEALGPRELIGIMLVTAAAVATTRTG
ncbi:MAG: EamA family transporter [Chloroflexi bacterium]|nr:EamA family transporter [Chloroflexota bacterium]MCC6895053.1 EamA family transporter [Anaerolineae bacterium]